MKKIALTVKRSVLLPWRAQRLVPTDDSSREN
jgi:hypothetical protein